MRFTKPAIDALSCPPGKRDVMYADDEVKGLRVRVNATGSKSFLFEYRYAGKNRRLPLGEYGQITVAQARRAAQEARGRVLAGGDPVGERKAVALAFHAAQAEEAREAVADALTLDVLVGRWQDGALKDRSENYRREGPRRLRHAFAPELMRPARALTLADVQARLDDIGENHPTTARRVHAYGRAMFAWAAKRRLVAENPFTDAVMDSRDEARERVLSDDELGAFWRATQGMGYPFGPYLRLLALTLQRLREVSAMRWDEIAPDLSTWTVPAERAKNSKAHIVHLSEPARRELAALHRQTAADGTISPLVFTNTGRTPISGFSDAKERILRLMDADTASCASEGQKNAGKNPPSPAASWTWHDLRRTGVTAMARLGIAPHVADLTLNHVPASIKGVAAVYQRHHFMNERAQALDVWAAHVLAVASGSGRTSASGNVVPFRR
ncbi:tyrosine-type recombinase/integrase [Brytella acorum]|uniref:Site-specific integrase n=1 Tax=Brytella acorum TaxID=2959299 RepID=A0AA35Y285_9PROT|nr:site-specific integrase [Brytella acorum]MDF3625703.1 site-specific integrase [Brytella acorum]CAI9121332.1 site-specific integrase [Brytella acorum]